MYVLHVILVLSSCNVLDTRVTSAIRLCVYHSDYLVKPIVNVLCLQLSLLQLVQILFFVFNEMSNWTLLVRMFSDYSSGNYSTLLG